MHLQYARLLKFFASHKLIHIYYTKICEYSKAKFIATSPSKQFSQQHPHFPENIGARVRKKQKQNNKKCIVIRFKIKKFTKKLKHEKIQETLSHTHIYRQIYIP